MDTPEQELDKLTTAINELAPKVLGVQGSLAVYEAGGLLTRARQLSQEGEQENFSSYLRNRTQFKRQTAYDCMSVFGRLKDTPLKQHLARIERTGSAELSKPENISQALFEEIMVDVLKRLENFNVYLSTGDIRKIIRAHQPRPTRTKEDNNDDDDDEEEEEERQEPPVCDNPSAVLTAIAFQGAVDDARRAAEVIQALQLTRETLRELRNEVSGLVDMPYLKQNI